MLVTWRNNSVTVGDMRKNSVIVCNIDKKLCLEQSFPRLPIQLTVYSKYVVYANSWDKPLPYT